MKEEILDYGEAYYRRRELRPTFQAEVRAIAATLALAKTHKLLEVGMGSGLALRQIARASDTRPVGLDWLDTSVKFAAHADSDYAVVCGDARSLPFADDSFHRLYGQHILEHFANPLSVMTEWKRVLRPAGRLVVVTPNRNFPYQDWFEDPTHRHIFTMEELEELLQSAGLTVVEKRFVNPFFLHWRFTDILARQFQILRHIPILARRSMSLLVAAEKPAITPGTRDRT